MIQWEGLLEEACGEALKPGGQTVAKRAQALGGRDSGLGSAASVLRLTKSFLGKLNLV